MCLRWIRAAVGRCGGVVCVCLLIAVVRFVWCQRLRKEAVLHKAAAIVCRLVVFVVLGLAWSDRTTVAQACRQRGVPRPAVVWGGGCRALVVCWRCGSVFGLAAEKTSVVHEFWPLLLPLLIKLCCRTCCFRLLWVVSRLCCGLVVRLAYGWIVAVGCFVRRAGASVTSRTTPCTCGVGFGT